MEHRPWINRYSAHTLNGNWNEERVLDKDIGTLRTRGFMVDTTTKNRSSPFIVTQEPGLIEATTTYRDKFAGQRPPTSSSKHNTMTDATIDYIEKHPPPMTRSTGNENRFETTQREYGKFVGFQHKERDMYTQEVAGEDPEHVFILPPSGKTFHPDVLNQPRSTRDYRKRTFFSKPKDETSGTEPLDD
ncbi:hypothetical protein BLNAU_193 [Blattamonas nauphoetae]|uniref:Uncharacterized protein n=1 Tax=Blattamonas nauphoetae TaxID=2049346 RepID=A0ABQ9YMC2_9EUKA|nr:hypothetical protein BLNAU_193 [Blattamonas nauphoetae]